MRFDVKGEKGIRMASMLVTVITLVSLADIFFDALLSCLLLLWKHTAGGIAVPVLGDGKEIELKLLSWISFGLAVVAVYGLRKRLKAVFQGEQPFIRVQAQTVKSCFLLEVINSMDAEEQREEMIKNRREEREEQQKKLEEEREKNKNDKIVDTVEISEDGKVLLKENTAAESGAVDGVGADGANPDGETNGKPKADPEPAFYSSAGTVEQSENTGTKVSASV